MKKNQQDSINQLVTILDKSYLSKKMLFFRSFFSGVFSALGATFGLTVVVVLVGYLIKILGGLPVIGDWINYLKTFFQ